MLLKVIIPIIRSLYFFCKIILLCLNYLELFLRIAIANDVILSCSQLLMEGSVLADGSIELALNLLYLFIKLINDIFELICLLDCLA